MYTNGVDISQATEMNREAHRQGFIAGLAVGAGLYLLYKNRQLKEKINEFERGAGREA